MFGIAEMHYTGYLAGYSAVSLYMGGQTGIWSSGLNFYQPDGACSNQATSSEMVPSSVTTGWQLLNTGACTSFTLPFLSAYPQASGMTLYYSLSCGVAPPTRLRRV